MRGLKRALVGLLLLTVMCAKAQFSYSISGGAATITGYMGFGPVTIPSVVNGMPVVGIGTGNPVFALAQNMTNVTIPNSVTNIGASAFASCRGIHSIAIPGSVLTIGMSAFSSCSVLTNVMLTNGLFTIQTNAFNDCEHLNNIALPASLTTIQGGAFANCYALSNVVIPSGVTHISGPLFGYCAMAAIQVDTNNTAFATLGGVLFDHSFTRLIEYPPALGGNYVVPDGIVTIDSSAFYGTPISSISIPATVTNIGLEALSTGGLTNISVDVNNSDYTSVGGVLFDYNQLTLIQYPVGRLDTTYTIPSSVTSIGDFSFLGSHLAKVTIPSNVTNVGNYTFDFSLNLTNVDVGSNVLALNSYAFYHCTALNSVYFAGNAPSVGGTTFSGDNATIYYVPGTTGWTSSYNGLPTLLWNPAIQTADGSFGVQNNQFGFNITGTTNIPVELDAATNLLNPIWTPIQSLLLTNGSYYFSDAQWSHFPGRFYRIRSQ